MTRFPATMSPEQLEARLRSIAPTPEVRGHIEEINAILAPLTHGERLQFWSNRRGSLSGLTPLDALARDQLRAVRAAAEAFAE